MRLKIISLLLLMGASLHAQKNIGQLLDAGIEDAKQFTKSYMSPGSKGLVSGLSNGWYNSGKGKNFGQFEISIIGNGSFVSDKHKEFQLNTANYKYLKFEDPSVEQMMVATVFGRNKPDIPIKLLDSEGKFTGEEILLPQGIGSSRVNIIPSGYLQASVGILKGTEVKLRYLPKVKIEDVSTSLYGGAIQHELTSWIQGTKLLPLSISALVGYTSLKGSYDLEDNNREYGDQKIKTHVNSWLFTAIVSTKLPVVNFYGGVGYVAGNSDTHLKGTYRSNEGVTLTAPYGVSNNSDGFKATLGAKLSLGFFRFNADYSFQDFNNVSVGVNFGI